MRLLALVDSPDHVCCRYRIRAFERALQRAGCSLSCQALQRGTLSRIAQLHQAAQFESVILQRKLLPHWQLAFLRRSARHLVFDFDDAVLFRDSYASRGPHSAWRERRFEATVRVVDTVVAGNHFLCECALRAGAPAERVRTIPTCVEVQQDPASEAAHGKLDGSGLVDLLWIGSSATLRGLEQTQALWDRLGATIPGLRLRVICDRFPNFQTIPVVPVPWSQATEARELASGHIGVSWLPDDLWSRGKCGLKILQYQAAGLPVVANPVGMHTQLIEPGVTGFLPTTADQWIESVATLAANPDLRRKMGQLARRRVESGFSIGAWAETFVTSVTRADQPAPPGPRQSRGNRQGSIPDPFLLRVKRFGFLDRTTLATHMERNREHD
jgi:hypothetical protein